VIGEPPLFPVGVGVQVKVAVPLETCTTVKLVGAAGTALTIVMLKAACADAPLWSVTIRVNLCKVAADVGVPVICPVLPNASPLGSEDPLANAHVYDGTPPWAFNVWLYGEPIEALPSVRCAILTASETWIVIEAVVLTWLASVTVTEVVVVTALPPAGPVMAPDGERVRPAGSVEPFASDQMLPEPDGDNCALYAAPGETIGKEPVVMVGALPTLTTTCVDSVVAEKPPAVLVTRTK
jgi:hypothetical protein